MHASDAGASPAATAEDWRVGLGRVCTTPDPPTWLYGYACESRYRPFDGKLQDVYAKAMALEDAQGGRGLLITIDVCVLRALQAAAMLERVVARTGLQPEQILINMSHTHSGPLVGSPHHDFYPLSTAERQRTVAYTRQLYELVADAADAALGDFRPARLSVGQGEVGFVMNRRQFDEAGNYRGMGPNPELHTDPRVPVLRVDAPDGQLRALVFGLACHGVTLGADNTKLSGDYPGFAQAFLEADHPGVQAMFMQGCGADANSHPRTGADEVEQVERHGKILATEVSRVAEGELRPVRGPLRTERARAELPLHALPPRERLEQLATGPFWESYNGKHLLALLDRGETPATHCPAPLAVWQLGQDLTLVGVSGETVSGFVPLIEAALGPERLWIAGYCNEVFGYLPTARIVAEGGYECLGTVPPSGFFAAEAQDVVVSMVTALAERAGRPRAR